MRYAISFVVLALIAAAVGILNYALTLEHLEDKFYREGLANYTQADYINVAFADPFHDNLKEISCDETTHAFPWLALGTVGPIKPGDTINLLTPGHILLPKDGVTPIYAAFITVTGPIYADVTSVQGGFKVVIPTGISEQSYVVLMACKDKVNDETVASGPAITNITNWKSHSGITSRNGDVLRIFGERMGLKCERT
ncbi:hypothetical protein BGZ57DRAFT_991686 [Hyaloscypha finlandica]|nr:hypothetical protein BGZ57DRAFT_991686 [Hyaloscypha finlandica]